MKLLALTLLVILAALQYKLWVADGGVREMRHLTAEITAQRKENDTLQDRNRSLNAEIQDLKKGTTAIEERARNDLGMIGSNETFFQIVPQSGELELHPQERAAQLGN